MRLVSLAAHREVARLSTMRVGQSHVRASGQCGRGPSRRDCHRRPAFPTDDASLSIPPLINALTSRLVHCKLVLFSWAIAAHMHLNNRIAWQTRRFHLRATASGTAWMWPSLCPNLAVFAAHLAIRCHFVAGSCRFCHPELETSRSCGPQTGLNTASERRTRLMHNQKAAKTAMLTIPVNFATCDEPRLFSSSVSPPFPPFLRVSSRPAAGRAPRNHSPAARSAPDRACFLLPGVSRHDPARHHRQFPVVPQTRPERTRQL